VRGRLFKEKLSFDLMPLSNVISLLVIHISNFDTDLNVNGETRVRRHRGIASLSFNNKSFIF
jgi:hypothetical protein